MPSMTSAQSALTRAIHWILRNWKQILLDTYFMVVISPEGEVAAKKDVVAAPKERKSEKKSALIRYLF